MFTPQEIQEKTFVKAVFGGYDMQTVDEFLEPLTEDYIALYKENAVLKSKMKVLVEKLEEYRNQEQTMRKAMISAQKSAERIVADAERKAANIVNGAAAQAPAAAPAPAPVISMARAEAAEQEEAKRIECAQQTAQNFIDVLERDIRRHLELLESLKTQKLQPEMPKAPVTPVAAAPVAEQPKHKAFDFEEEEKPLVSRQSASLVFDPADDNDFSMPEFPPVEFQQDTPENIASEIEQNISKLMGSDEPMQEAPVKGGHPESATIKFNNLQFGKNYDPTNGN